MFLTTKGFGCFCSVPTSPESSPAPTSLKTVDKGSPSTHRRCYQKNPVSFDRNKTMTAYLDEVSDLPPPLCRKNKTAYGVYHIIHGGPFHFGRIDGFENRPLSNLY